MILCAAFEKERMKLKQKRIRTVQEGMGCCCEFRNNSSGLILKFRTNESLLTH
jgi:hypothetical protein